MTERVPVNDDTRVVALTGGARTRTVELVSFTYDDLFDGGSGGVSFVNLSDRDSVTVRTDTSRVTVAHGESVGSIESAPTTESFDVVANGGAGSYLFDDQKLGGRPTVVVLAGFTADDGLPFGIKTVQGAK